MSGAPDHPHITLSGQCSVLESPIFHAPALSALSRRRSDGAALGAGLNGFLTPQVSDLSVSFTSHRCVVVGTDSASW